MVRKYVACYLIIAMFIIGITPRVEAAFAPSQPLVVSPADRAGDVEKIRNVLEMKVVGQRLQDLGYTPEEIKAKLSQLTDGELHSIAQKIDDLKVGQDSALGIIIAILVIILLVILIINLSTGKKVVVTQ
jgi:hypothetical protein